MQAYDKIGLSFTRNGTDAKSVAAKIVDQNGKAIEGATATITSSHSAEAINESILCFDVNGNTSPTINFSVAISGLKESITYSLVGIDVHGLNGQSKYQQNNDNVNRFWNVNLKQNGNAFTFLEDIDIAAGIGECLTSVHLFWALEAESETAATGRCSQEHRDAVLAVPPHRQGRDLHPQGLRSHRPSRHILSNNLIIV